MSWVTRLTFVKHAFLMYHIIRILGKEGINLVINHYDGGYQAGKYFKELGHKKALCIADNFICMDKERIAGFSEAFEPGETLRWEIPKTEKERMCFYEDKYQTLLKNNVTAVFAVSDFYALEFMRFLQGKNIQIPKDIQIIGFDDNMASRESHPSLTTIHQEVPLRAKTAIKCLEAMRDGAEDTKEAWCSFDVSLISGIVIAALFLFAAGVFPSQILGLYTRDVSIVNTGAVYFRIVAFSYIPMAVSNIFSSWLRCREHATIPLLASFGAVAVNTGLNYLLIFGKFGFPCMGIKGAAIATLISQLFNLVFIAVGFALCIRKDGDKPVWSLRFSKITVRAYRRST